jgi:hypothetical protein
MDDVSRVVVPLLDMTKWMKYFSITNAGEAGEQLHSKVGSRIALPKPLKER